MAVFTNQAQLSYNDIVTNSNIAVGEILEVLSVTKTAVVDTYTADDTVTYVIQLINSGTTPLTGLTLTDNAGAYTFNETALVPLTYVDGSVKYFTDGVLQPAPVVTPGTDIVISGISVPANGTATVVYETSVNQFAPLGTDATVVNEVTVSGGGITSVTATETITAEDGAELSITKSVSPVPVAENGRLTYTFTIQNTGNQPVTVADNAVITDLFDPILSDLVVNFNGTAWTEPDNYTYDAATGSFVTVAGQVTVPAATYAQDPTTGVWTVTPGTSTLVVTGTV